MSRRRRRSISCEPLEPRRLLAAAGPQPPQPAAPANAAGGWQFEVELADLMRGQVVRVEAPGALRVVPREGSAAPPELQFALLDHLGRLIVATADPAGGAPAPLRQFVQPGDYVLVAGPAVPETGWFQIEFTPGSSPVLPVSVGSLPASVAAADLDGDGVLDLLVANLGSANLEAPDKGDLAVRFGHGDGSFRPGQSIRVGDNPVAVAVGAAGPPAAGLLAVTANRGGDSVSVIRISAGGAFATPLTIPVGRMPTAVALADVDGDGLTDIVVANSATGDLGPLPDATGSCSVLLQTAAGGFIEVARLPTGYNPGAVAAGNLDADDLADIVVTHPDSGTIVVFRGTADGRFDALTPPIPVGWKPDAVAIGDLDGDGRNDIVVANSMSDDVSVVRQRADGRFADPGPALPVGTSPYAVIVADVDGDGRADILTANQGSNDVSVLRGIGGGAFRSEARVATGSYPSGLAAGRFDADHTLDLVTADLNDGTVSLLRGFGDGGFLERRRLSAGSYPYAVAVGDVNGDGRADVVTANRESSDVSVLLGRGDGSFGRRQTLPVASFAFKPVDVVLADINGDGRLDIVTANEGLGLSTLSPEEVVPGGVCILFGLGDGSFTPPQVELQDRHLLAVAVADLDGDGLADIVATAGRPVEWEQDSAPSAWRVRNIPPGSVHVLLQNRDGTFSERQPGRTVGRLPTDVVLADVDGDGAIDMLVCTQGLAALDDRGGVAVLYGDGRGRFAAPIRLAAANHPQSLAVGDVDRNGRPDIVVVNVNRPDLGEGGDVSVLLQADRRRFVPLPDRLPVGDLPYGVVLEDFTGDGQPDILVSNVLGKSISLLAGAGDGGFAAAEFVPLGTAAPGGLAVGDIDGDGRPDLVTGNLVTNDVTVLMQSGWTTLGDEPNPFAGGVSQGVTLLAPAAGLPGGTITVDRGGNVIVRRGGPNGGVAAAASDVFDLSRLESADGSERFAAIDAGRTTISIRREAADGRLALEQRLAAPAADPAHPAAPVLMRIVSADLDGDGWGDLIVSNPAAGTLDVLVARRDGRFDDSAWQRLDAGAGPSRIIVGDVSGDSVPDLLAANQASGDVSIWLGVAGIHGTAAFTAETGFAPRLRRRTSDRPYGYATDPVSGKGTGLAPFNLSDIAVGDVDGDGIADLVAVNSQLRSVAVLAGTGHGNFAIPREYQLRVPDSSAATVAGGSVEAHDVVVGRFDADSRADIAILDRDGERLILMMGGSLGRGDSPATVIPLTGNLPRSISVMDATGPEDAPDGILDIVVGNDFGDVLTLQGVGDGTFRSYVRADRSVALLAADVDGDGADDFIYGSRGLDRIWLQRTGTKESFAADQKQGVLGPSAVVTVTETIHGRTYENLVVANGGANQILLFRRNVSGQAGSAELFEAEPDRFYVGTNPAAVFVTDVNADGLPDVLVANAGSNDVSVMLGVLDGERRWTMRPGPRLASGGSGPAGIAVGQFVGNDAIPDIAVTNRGSNSTAILRGIGRGFFDDARPTFLPLSLAAPGPIVALPRPGGPPLIAVGSALGDQFQTFDRRGGGYRVSGTYLGGGSALATTSFGGSTYLAAGSAAGSVSIFLHGPSMVSFLTSTPVSLPGLTGLAFDSAGRLFGMSPTRDGALALFSFDSPGEGAGGSAGSGILLVGAQAFTTRLVFTPLKVAGIGLVAALVTSEGLAVTARFAGEPLRDASAEQGKEADGGGIAAEEADGETAPRSEVEAEAESEAESNPLLDFVLDAEAQLETWNKRLAAILLDPADHGGEGDPNTRSAPAEDAPPAGIRPAPPPVPAAGPPHGSRNEESFGPAANRMPAAARPMPTAEAAPLGAAEPPSLSGRDGSPIPLPIRLALGAPGFLRGIVRPGDAFPASRRASSARPRRAARAGG
jgi:hypothetical protein